MIGTSCPATGTILVRDIQATGDFMTVAVTLPLAFWDQLTAEIASFDRDARGDASLPDLGLDERIALFLNIEVAGWEARPAITLNRRGEPDDPPPFG